MVGDDSDRMGSSLDVLFPFVQCEDDGKEFPVVDVIVPFSRDKRLREVGAGMGIAIEVILEEDSSSSEEGSVGHDRERARNVWDAKDWPGGKGGAEGIKSLLLEWSPVPRLVLSSEEIEGGDNMREVWDEFAIKICES